MIDYVWRAAQQVDLAALGFVLSEKVMQQPHTWPEGSHFFIQPVPRGTGDAVHCGLPLLDAAPEEADLLILLGDGPLVTAEDIRALLAGRDRYPDGALFVLGMTLSQPTGYGRLRLMGDVLEEIVEERHASTEERDIKLCHSGVMLIRGAVAREFVPRLAPMPGTQESYITSIVHQIRMSGLRCYTCPSASPSLQGINTFEDLATVSGHLQNRFRQKALGQGANIPSPEHVFMSWDTSIGGGAVIEPFVVCGAGVTIAPQATILSFSYLEKTHIAAGSIVGPFARLQQSEVAEDSVVGNFVEVKRSQLAEHVKAKHLSYIGDAVIGAFSNIGAGTVFCNYDGMQKHSTQIGQRSFIGANSTLIAPLSIGDDVMIGGGSVVTEPVADGYLAVSRAPCKQVVRRSKVSRP